MYEWVYEIEKLNQWITISLPSTQKYTAPGFIASGLNYTPIQVKYDGATPTRCNILPTNNVIT